jgi:hypothetical protein
MRSAYVGPSATAATPVTQTAAMSATSNGYIVSSDIGTSPTIALPKPTIFQEAAVLAQESAALQDARDHAAALTEQRAIIGAITRLQPAWQPLPLGPYPPASDNSGFPKTGDPSLIVSASQVTADQLKEPALYAQGLADQASARLPQLNALFWLGLACLGVGIYIHHRR